VTRTALNLPGWFPGVGAAIDLATFDPFPQVPDQLFNVGQASGSATTAMAFAGEAASSVAYAASPRGQRASSHISDELIDTFTHCVSVIAPPSDSDPQAIMSVTMTTQ
jgi:hypothetical protein